MSVNEQATVCIVEDNSAVRDSVRWLVEQVGLNAATYSSANEFLAQHDPDIRGCLILDIRMPGMSGLELQEHLIQSHITLPIIFITGHGDVPIAVRAMKAGAFDFLQKPFNDQALLDSIYAAIRKHDELCADLDRKTSTSRYLTELTKREREVLTLLRQGKSSKEIAEDLTISVRTVEGHRSHLMTKMHAKTIGHLIELVSVLEVPNR